MNFFVLTQNNRVIIWKFQEKFLSLQQNPPLYANYLGQL